MTVEIILQDHLSNNTKKTGPADDREQTERESDWVDSRVCCGMRSSSSQHGARGASGIHALHRLQGGSARGGGRGRITSDGNLSVLPPSLSDGK